MENEKQQTGIPENAFRELKEGEAYEPLMSPERTYKEVTVWSVLWGVLMAVVFSLCILLPAILQLNLRMKKADRGVMRR